MSFTDEKELFPDTANAVPSLSMDGEGSSNQADSIADSQGTGHHKLAKADAINAERAEKDMSLWTSLKLYRRAVFWCVAISLTLVMEGTVMLCSY